MYRKQLENWCIALGKTIGTYEAELRDLPPGRLYRSTNKRGVQYQHSFHDDEGKHLVGINKRPELKKQLARKAFLEKSLALLERNREALTRIGIELAPYDPDSVIASLGPSYAELPRTHFLTPQADAALVALQADTVARLRAHEAWAAAPYTRFDAHPERLIHRTTAGLYVRSRAELAIAEKLHDLGAPFRYEQLLQLGEHTFAPDFTFETVDGSPLYLEYCGMMDDPTYEMRHRRKLDIYARFDILPWTNLICVYGTSGGVDMAWVSSVLEHLVIPRL